MFQKNYLSFQESTKRYIERSITQEHKISCGKPFRVKNCGIKIISLAQMSTNPNYKRLNRIFRAPTLFTKESTNSLQKTTEAPTPASSIIDQNFKNEIECKLSTQIFPFILNCFTKKKVLKCISALIKYGPRYSFIIQILKTCTAGSHLYSLFRILGPNTSP